MGNSTWCRIQKRTAVPAKIRGCVFSRHSSLINGRMVLAGLALIMLCSINNKALAFGTTYYYPSSVTAGTGGTYCAGTAASAISGSIIPTSATAIGGTSSTVQWYWYYNTTGTAGTLTGATLAYTGATYTANAATYIANLPGTSISTTTPGTYYYFLYVTWSGGTAAPGSLFSTLATVIVNGSPTPISGDPIICLGTTVPFSDGVAGGTWTSSVPTVGSVSGTGSVTGLTTGTTLLTYDDGCGVPATLLLSVNPFPAAITGPNNLCEGTNVTLNDATAGGAWSSSTIPVATVISAGTSGIVTGISGGTADISYTAAGCSSIMNVTVTSLPAAIAGSFRECIGSATNLTDSLSGGTWSSSDMSIATVGSLSGVVTGAEPGTTIITYTTGCGYVTATDTSIAIPATIVGVDSACAGSKTVLADVTLGGTWSSGMPSVATVLPGSGIITGVSAGTATITYTIPPGCYVTDVVKINPLPPAINGSTPVCVGNTITLTDAVAGTWSSLQSYIASAAQATGVVTGVSADTTSIVFTNTSGCTAATTVTVNPLPLPISGGNITCGASADTVYDATPGGTWSSTVPGVATINATTGIIATVAGGTTTISYSLLSTGCAATKVVAVYPVPNPIVTYDFATNSFFTDTFYVSYQWYDSLQGMIAGANSFQTAALYNGNYWVVVNDTNGCTGTSTAVHYNVNEAGVQNHTNSAVHIYPNPASGIVYIESVAKVMAVVTGIDGKTEIQQPEAKQIDISKLTKGIYFISLYDDNGERLMVQKLIKK